jgi:hypothetical protein
MNAELLPVVRINCRIAARRGVGTKGGQRNSTAELCALRGVAALESLPSAQRRILRASVEMAARDAWQTDRYVYAPNWAKIRFRLFKVFEPQAGDGFGTPEQQLSGALLPYIEADLEFLHLIIDLTDQGMVDLSAARRRGLSDVNQRYPPRLTSADCIYAAHVRSCAYKRSRHDGAFASYLRSDAMQAFIGATLLPSTEAQPQSKPFEISDNRLPGFILRIQPSGVRTYYARFGRNRRVVLGKAGTIAPEEARERCQMVLGNVCA